MSRFSCRAASHQHASSHTYTAKRCAKQPYHSYGSVCRATSPASTQAGTACGATTCHDLHGTQHVLCLQATIHVLQSTVQSNLIKARIYLPRSKPSALQALRQAAYEVQPHVMSFMPRSKPSACEQTQKQGRESMQGESPAHLFHATPLSFIT